MKTLDRTHWLAATPAVFYFYKDHNNPIFLLDPLAVVDDMSQSSRRKVLLWAVKLSAYYSTPYHSKVEENLLAELLTGRFTVLRTVHNFVRDPDFPLSCSEDL